MDALCWSCLIIGICVRFCSFGMPFHVRCLKTINSKKYGVDLVCFTAHPTTVIYSSKNGWDGKSTQHCSCVPLFGLEAYAYYLFTKMSQNLCGLFLWTTTSICGILKVTMTGTPPFSPKHTSFCELIPVEFQNCIKMTKTQICFARVVSLSLCPRKEYFVSGSLDRTVLLWDQRADKSQVGSLGISVPIYFMPSRN